MKRAFVVSAVIACFILSIAAFLQASGIVPAIVPTLVPSANRRGTVTGCGGNGCFQLASSASAGSTGAAYCDDGSGNLTTTGCTTNAVTSSTPVTTSGGSVTTDQQMMELSLTAGYLNSLGRAFDFVAAGTYTLPVAQTPQLTLKIKLCTVSGCGSGTVVTLISIQTAAATANVTTLPWNIRTTGIIATAGATGNLEIHGPLVADIGALATTADTIYSDTNTAVSSNIDLTAALFVDFTFAFSTGSASNVATQRTGAVLPSGATAGAGTGALVQISKQTLGSAANNITFSGIPGTYNNLYLTLNAASDQSTTTELVNIQFNADTGANYNIETLSFTGSSAPSASSAASATALQPTTIPGTSSPAGSVGPMRIEIFTYSGTTFWKDLVYQSGENQNGMAASMQAYNGWGEWKSTAAITSIKIFPSAGNFITGSTAVLYGEN